MKKAALFETIWHVWYSLKLPCTPGDSQADRQVHFLIMVFSFFTMINVLKHFPLYCSNTQQFVCRVSGILFREPTFVCHMYLISSTIKFSMKQIFIAAIFCG